MTAPGAGRVTARGDDLDVLSIGMTWLSEQPGNGLDRGYYEHVRHLPAAGVRVRGLVAGSPAVERESGGTVRAFASEKAPLPTRLRSIRRAVREELERRTPDVVVSHFALHAAPVTGMLKVPLVVHFHGPWAAESAVEGASRLSVAIKRAIERNVYRRADRFVVLSEAFRQILVETYRVDDSRIRIVPGGVEMARFDTGLTRDEARRILGWPERPTVLAVRRLTRRMGLEGLIEAMSIVRATNPEALLLIAGRGPSAPALQVEIDRLGQSDGVRLLGFVPDEMLPAAYAAADLTVMPTVALEGFGLPTVESLAAGTPVVVTPQGGLPEVVRDLDPGLICEDTSPAALAARIGAALSGGMRMPSADACRDYASSRFAWESIATRLAGVYRDARDEHA